MPGVPAAGHVVRGNWHPGRADNCQKAPCRDDNESKKFKPRLDFGRMPRQRSTNAEDQ